MPSKNMIRIGFIGTGNLGGALVKGLASSGLDPTAITVFDIDRTKIESIQRETKVKSAVSIKALISSSDVIVLAVKPNSMADILELIKDASKEPDGPNIAVKLYITVAAAIHSDFYKKYLGSETRIIRAMPNTPALVNEGMTVLSFTEKVTPDDMKIARDLFSSVGRVEVIDEKYMNDVIALISSSPAYVFMFIEALADGAVLSGLPRKLSYELASQAVLGSAKMVLETGLNPGVLKDQVCSPGGTTIEAVSALEKNRFRFAVIDAMKECSKKAREISLHYTTEK